MSETKISRWVRQGRGSGAGPDYLPWLRVTDVPSSGFSHRLWCQLTGRMHHYLSFLEYKAHLMALSDPSVVDIREAYPLERTETRRLAELFGVPHPRYPGTRIDTVMTTDLLLTCCGSQGRFYEAWPVKPVVALANYRVREKLFLERAYHLERNNRVRIVTERQLPAVLLRNLERIRFALNLEMHPAFDELEARQLQATLLGLCAERQGQSYASFCTQMDIAFGLATGDTHYLLTNLMGHGVMLFDLTKPWDVNQAMGIFRVIPHAFAALLAAARGATA